MPNLITAGAILGTLVAVERLYGLRLDKIEGLSSFIDIALLGGLVVSGFISGERCFSAELKEHRMLFLASLPLSRNWAWLAIVSARLSAALIALALVVALRRPLPAPLPVENIRQLEIAAVSLFLLLYLLLFSAGTLFAHLSRRTLFVYAVGYPLVGLLLVETFLACSYPTIPPVPWQLAIAPFDPAPIGSRSVLLAAFLAFTAFLSLLLLSWLLLSWRFFVRGEVSNPKQRLRNQLLFGITVAAYLGFVLSVATSARLVSIRGTWTVIDPSTWLQSQSRPYGVSADGRYLFVFETLDRSPFIVRVSLVDTRTGQLSGRSTYGGVAWGFWSKNQDVLNLLILDNSPLGRWGYLKSGMAWWLRLTPAAREVSKTPLKGVEAVEILAGGRAVVSLRDGDQRRVLLLEGASGRSSEVVRAPADGEVVIYPDGPVALVYFDNSLLPKRAWVVDSVAQEVPAPRARPRPDTYYLFGKFLATSTDAHLLLQQKVGPPATAQGQPIEGIFILPSDQPWVLPPGLNPKGYYFVGRLGLQPVHGPTKMGLWARSATEQRWNKMPELAPEPAYVTHNSSIRTERALPPISIDPGSGVGVFMTTDGDSRRLFVYDPQVGVVQGPSGCRPGDDKGAFGVDRVPGFDGILINMLCPAKPLRYGFFAYPFGSRKILALRNIPILSLPLYLDEVGGGVWRTYEGKVVWRSSPQGKALSLWPTAAD
ncbi:MAG TPA: hypothetical protein VFE33_14615 [Thermoanaerobaculia bacterium]|nr:hypothetical protein [Thermoanaerobaculia bacterium]